MNGNHLQAMMDGLSANWQRERSESQMTLGKLIERLESMDQESRIEGIHEAHSYRGYYCDLAFERAEPMKVSDALKICRSCMGEVFQGYKGGNYQMGRNTPVWVASYGCCGSKIMDLTDDGKLELGSDD